MKRILVSLLCGIALFIGGCSASIAYKGSDGTEIIYKRFGIQKMKDVDLKLSDGSSLHIGEQESDPTELIKLGIKLGALGLAAPILPAL